MSCLILWVMVLTNKSFQDRTVPEGMGTFDELNEENFDTVGPLDEERLIEHELEIKENTLQRKKFPTRCHGVYRFLCIQVLFTSIIT